MTAAYGTTVARPGGNDEAYSWRRWLQLGQRVRPVPGDHRLVAKSPKGSRQLGTRPSTFQGLLIA
jgi:hypothetical protein